MYPCVRTQRYDYTWTLPALLVAGGLTTPGPPRNRVKAPIRPVLPCNICSLPRCIYIDRHECRRWATLMREMRDASLFTYTVIYLYRSLLLTPFSLPPPLPGERPSLLKFLGGATGFWAPRIPVHTETSSAAGGCGNNCAGMQQVVGLSRVSESESEGRQISRQYRRLAIEQCNILPRLFLFGLHPLRGARFTHSPPCVRNLTISCGMREARPKGRGNKRALRALVE